MAFDLTNVDSYKAYFTAIANKHKQIESFSYGDQDVVNSEIRSWKGRKLWLWPYDSITVEENSNDNYLDKVPGSFFIGGAAGSTKFAVENDYIRDCEQIVKDIRNKMLQDMANQIILTRLNGWSRQPVELVAGATKLIGYELKFFFHDSTGFEYDETKWNP
jgi:hypothetical protein